MGRNGRRALLVRSGGRHHDVCWSHLPSSATRLGLGARHSERSVLSGPAAGPSALAPRPATADGRRGTRLDSGTDRSGASAQQPALTDTRQ